ncbi:YopX family protein [Enterococcus sp. S86.2]|uniref:YopX family protein n=1 Tax=Enterococcus sp. S86.2 TaxID=3031299 RepID=UPI0026EF668E|nr:YopX family protein [Enterococcus sp. S86.2]
MIKFRAWFEESVLKKAHMVDWEELKEFRGLSRLFDDAPHSETFSLMQSTGLKDKNGVEIYENDIVLENGMQRVITLGEQRYEENYGDLVYYIGFNIFTKWGYSSITPVEYEVLGNIYENSDLLEDKND